MRAGRYEELFGISGKIALVTDCEGLASRKVAPLLAEAGAYITGQAITLDGGFFIA